MDRKDSGISCMSSSPNMTPYDNVVAGLPPSERRKSSEPRSTKLAAGVCGGRKCGFACEFVCYSVCGVYQLVCGGAVCVRVCD